MKQLESLEGKITQVISKNRELTALTGTLKDENNRLRDEVNQLQARLLKESTSTTELSDERNAMKASIEKLLESIDSLESTSR